MASNNPVEDTGCLRQDSLVVYIEYVIIPPVTSTRIFLTFVDATDIACHTKIRQAHDFGCMQ
jgi:hypothetical protein